MDAKISDHAYPKHVDSPSLRSADSLVPAAIEPRKTTRQSPSSCLLNPKKTPCSDLSVDSYQVAGVQKELNRKGCLSAGMEKESSVLVPGKCLGTGGSDATQAGAFSPKKRQASCRSPDQGTHVEMKRMKTRKPNNRDTDHMYNTRQVETDETHVTLNKEHANTDHVHNTRKESREQRFPSRRNNRDTDHMYNLKSTGTSSQKVIASSECRDPAEKRHGGRGTPVDRRVVDKDHMYQHNVSKSKNKVDNRERAKNKRQSPCNQVGRGKSKKKKTDLKSERLQQDTTHLQKNLSDHHRKKPGQTSGAGDTPDISLSKRNRPVTGSSGSSVKEADVPVKKEPEGPKCTSNAAHERADNPLSEHGYTSVQSKGSVTLGLCASVSNSSASTVKCASPTASENDSDPVCEDDSRRAAVFNSDHVYTVHADYLDSCDMAEAKEPVLSKCVSVEGYKQEHSYAFTEVINYHACVNCSQLVQQLIGTIDQQRSQIYDLKKQLQVANAKNKHLSSMASRQLEDGN